LGTGELPGTESGSQSEPPGQKQDEKNDDNKAGASSQEMVAGFESVASACKKQENDQNDDEVHDVFGLGCRRPAEEMPDEKRLLLVTDCRGISLSAGTAPAPWGVHPTGPRSRPVDRGPAGELRR
jgi:hypothetical protein